MPEKPGWLEQDEFEERTRIGFNLERLVKTMHGLDHIAAALQRRDKADRGDGRSKPETLIEEIDEFRTTRIDVEAGPEIIKIERK